MNPFINIAYRPLLEGIKRLIALRAQKHLDQSEAGHQKRYDAFQKVIDRVNKLDPAKTYGMIVLAVTDNGDSALALNIVEGPGDLVELMSCLHGAGMARDQGDLQELGRLSGEVGRALQAETETKAQSMADAGEFLHALDPASTARPVGDMTFADALRQSIKRNDGERATDPDAAFLDFGACECDICMMARNPNGSVLPDTVSETLKDALAGGVFLVVDGDLGSVDAERILRAFKNSPFGKGGNGQA